MKGMDSIFNDKATLINNNSLFVPKTETVLKRDLKELAFISTNDFIENSEKYLKLLENKNVSLIEEKPISPNIIIPDTYFTELFVNHFNNNYFSLNQYKNYSKYGKNCSNYMFTDFIRYDQNKESFKEFLFLDLLPTFRCVNYLPYFYQQTKKDVLGSGYFLENKLFFKFSFKQEDNLNSESTKEFPFFNGLQQQNLTKIFSNINIKLYCGLDVDFLIKGVWIYYLNGNNLNENSKLLRWYENEAGLLCTKNREILISFEQNDFIDYNYLKASNSMMIMFDIDMITDRLDDFFKEYHKQEQNYFYYNIKFELTSSFIDLEKILVKCLDFGTSDIKFLENGKIKFLDLLKRLKEDKETKPIFNSMNFNYPFLYTIMIYLRALQIFKIQYSIN